MTLEPSEFKKLYTQKLKERKEYIQQREGLVVKTCSEIAQKILDSNLIK